jgi:hypothetical protein
MLRNERESAVSENRVPVRKFVPETEKVAEIRRNLTKRNCYTLQYFSSDAIRVSSGRQRRWVDSEARIKVRVMFRQ